VQANFDPAIDHVVPFVLIATLVNVAAGTLVAALSVPFDSLGSANLCATIAMLVLLLLNGALLNLAAAPRVIGLLQQLSFFRYGFEAMLGNELHNKVITIDAPGERLRLRGRCTLRGPWRAEGRACPCSSASSGSDSHAGCCALGATLP
jgi:hypothetical protein